jgi:hypothetical protein
VKFKPEDNGMLRTKSILASGVLLFMPIAMALEPDPSETVLRLGQTIYLELSARQGEPLAYAILPGPPEAGPYVSIAFLQERTSRILTVDNKYDTPLTFQKRLCLFREDNGRIACGEAERTTAGKDNGAVLYMGDGPLEAVTIFGLTLGDLPE